ncbi:MAG TPA: hypothetical protein VGC57_13185 [Cellulomonas sp.]
METVEARPSWQVDPCPSWCVVRHEPEDHQHDRKHMSTWLTVPAVELVPTGAGGAAGADRAGPREEEQGADLALCLHRRDGAATVWLYVGDGERQMLELTAESWSRLVPAVERLLARAGA